VSVLSPSQVNVSTDWKIAHAQIVRILQMHAASIKTDASGTGVFVKTPDGTKTYKISVNNAGDVTSTLVS
jgi:hypothetical protein